MLWPYHIGIVYSEELVNRAIFRASEEQAKDDDGVLAAERGDVSTVVSGGAGSKYLFYVFEMYCLDCLDV